MPAETQFPVPLVTAHLSQALPGTIVLDSSSNTPLVAPFQGDIATYGEVNVYNYSYTDVSGNIFTFSLTDTIEWDVNNYVVYKNVVVAGNAGPIGNEIDAEITAITEIWGDPADNAVIQDINKYLQQIQEAKTHGMGTLAEYTELLALATDISGSVPLSLDISGLTELANAAEQYGDLFYTIEQNLSRVTTIDSLSVLNNIKTQLGRIAEMYDNLEALKISISRTSTLKISDDIQTTADKLNLAYNQVAGSLDYLKHFAGLTGQSGNFDINNATMNAYDKATIVSAKGALTLFKSLVDEQQAGITHSNNTQVKNLKDKVDQFQNLVTDMTSVKTALQNALVAAGASVAGHPNGPFNPLNP